MPSHGQVVAHQNQKVHFCKAVVQFVALQHVPVPGVIPSQLQEFALPFVEFYKICLRPILQNFKVPLDFSTTLWWTNHLPPFCMICKLAEDAVSPSIRVINEEVKQYW